MTFSEAVSAELGGLTVVNSSGERVDDGPTSQPRPQVLSVAVRPDLANGTYVANYRVVSADGHPVSGAIVFSVGSPLDEAGVSSVMQGASPISEALGVAGRFAAYTGGLLAAGLAFFAWFVHDQAEDRSRLTRPVVVAAAVGIVGQLAVVVAQAALASGSGLGVLLDLSLLSKVLGGSLGWSTAVLVLGLAGCAISMSQRSALVAQCLSFYGLVGVTVAYGLWGHEPPERWINFGADIVHGAAAAVWFGGLVGLAFVLTTRAGVAQHVAEGALARGGEAFSGTPAAIDGQVAPEIQSAEEGSLADTVGIVIRFSTVATVAVVLIGMTGLGMARLELGAPEAFVSTAYGRMLMFKLAVVAFVAAIAAYNHFRLVPWVLGESSPNEGDEDEAPVTEGDRLNEDVEPDEPDLAHAEWRRLISAVRLEAVGIVVVLVLTAVLANLTPGRADAKYVDIGPFAAEKPVGKGQVEIVVSPARVGANTIHITYETNDHRAADLAQSVVVEMALPERGVGPFSQNATKAGFGHFTVQSTPEMSIPGRWKVTLVSRLGEFEQERTEFSVPIVA